MHRSRKNKVCTPLTKALQACDHIANIFTKSGKSRKNKNREREEKTDEKTHREEVIEEIDSIDSLPYNVEISDIMGRYLVASRDLQPGDLILSEKALVVGPCHGCSPLCLGCYKKLEDDEIDVRCPGCRWPLCGPSCPGLHQDLGHSSGECAAHAAHGTASRLPEDAERQLAWRFYYNAITPLRCLLLKSSSPAHWRTLLTMEAHNEIRRRIPDLWQKNQELIVNTIRNLWGMTQFSEDEIHTICGVLEVNAFEIGQHGVSVRSLFPVAFLLCHDCVPNTNHTDDDSYHLTIRSSTPIPKGAPITLSYAYTMQSTLKRREHLKESKFFECVCSRCSDPTEQGTLLGALKCPRCSHGCVLSTNPLDQEAPWRCMNAKCPGYTISATSIQMLMDRIGEEVEAIDTNDVEGLEDFLSRYRNVLHENHYHRLGAKHTLCQLYGKIEGYTINVLSDKLLQRKRDLCKEIMTVFDVIEPGYSRLRGVTLYELHAPIMILATRRFEAHSINKRELGKQLKEVVKCLQEASIILGYEPRTSPEGLMCAAAKDALVRLGDWQTVIGKLNT